MAKRHCCSTRTGDRLRSEAATEQRAGDSIEAISSTEEKWRRHQLWRVRLRSGCQLTVSGEREERAGNRQLADKRAGIAGPRMTCCERQFKRSPGKDQLVGLFAFIAVYPVAISLLVRTYDAH